MVRRGSKGACGESEEMGEQKNHGLDISLRKTFLMSERTSTRLQHDLRSTIFQEHHLAGQIFNFVTIRRAVTMQQDSGIIAVLGVYCRVQNEILALNGSWAETRSDGSCCPTPAFLSLLLLPSTARLIYSEV